MKIAFTLIPSQIWMGGFNYLVNLVTGLVKFESERIRPVLYCGERDAPGDVDAFARIEGVEVVRDETFSPASRRWGLRQAVASGVDVAACRCFERDGIDLVFEVATFYGWRFPIPTIAWFADFQHREMPELFSRAGWWRRDLGFRFQVLFGRQILVSSETARSNCERYFPRSRGRVAVLKFPARVAAGDLADDPAGLLAEYRLPDAFAYLPNHFWKHKNHAIVVEALGRLVKQGALPCVVATGNQNDYRHPEHFAALQRRIEALKIPASSFRNLGTVPRRHVLALMQTCSVLLNPSCYEGWSSTVEEGKALGVPMLLSDIAVHREQAATQAEYFAVRDGERLATLLAASLERRPAVARSLIADCDLLLQEFSRRFAEIALAARGIAK